MQIWFVVRNIIFPGEAVRTEVKSLAVRRDETSDFDFFDEWLACSLICEIFVCYFALFFNCLRISLAYSAICSVVLIIAGE